MEKFVNLKMLGHPINWLIVWVVLLIVGFAFKELHQGISRQSSNDIPD